MRWFPNTRFNGLIAFHPGLIHNLHSRSPLLDIPVALKFTFWDNAIKNRLSVNFCPWGK